MLERQKWRCLRDICFLSGRFVFCNFLMEGDICCHWPVWWSLGSYYPSADFHPECGFIAGFWLALLSLGRKTGKKQHLFVPGGFFRLSALGLALALEEKDKQGVERPFVFRLDLSDFGTRFRVGC